MQDRRRHARRKAHWPVIVQLKDGSGFKTHTIDVSESGISIASTIKVPEGERVNIGITAVVSGKKMKITCIAECRFLSLSNHIYQCGMKLLSTTKEHRTFIHSYVEQGSELGGQKYRPLHPSEVKHASSQ